MTMNKIAKRLQKHASNDITTQDYCYNLFTKFEDELDYVTKLKESMDEFFVGSPKDIPLAAFSAGGSGDITKPMSDIIYSLNNMKKHANDIIKLINDNK